MSPAALPKIPAFDLDKPARTGKVSLTKLKSKHVGASTYSMVAGATGAWLVPDAPARGEALFSIDAKGSAKEAWSATVAASLHTAKDSAGSLLVAAVRSPGGTFSFPRLQRVFKLSSDGKIESDHPFPSAAVFPQAVAALAGGRSPDTAPPTAGGRSPDAGAGPSGSLLVAGTLAGPLPTEKGPLTPEAGGRAEVLFAIDAAGKTAWATSLARTSGRITALAAATDGTALLVSSPMLGEQVLTAISPGGQVAWEKHLVSTPPASFPSPSILALSSDGKGGFFLHGQSSEEGGQDLGLGPLTGNGYYVARLDAKGQCLWQRFFEVNHTITSDGAGSLLAFPTFPEGDAPRLYEIDAEARVTRAITLDLPAECHAKKHPVTVEVTGALGPKTLFVAVVCQEIDDSYQDPPPLGKPIVYTGTLPRD